MKQLSPDLVRAVEDRMITTFLLAQDKFHRHFELPSLSFELNSINIAGKAQYRTNKIWINPQYLTQHTEEVLNRTVGHECGHLINKIIYPAAKQSHGPEFKYVMRSLGLPDSRCHRMKLVSPKTPHIYKCPCQEVYLSNCIHARCVDYARRGGYYYKCRTCKSPFIYVRTMTRQDFINAENAANDVDND